MKEKKVAPFNELQQRLNRKKISDKLVLDFPCHVRLYDILFDGEEDLRTHSFKYRRLRLEQFFEEKKYDDARFMFERSIVFNPKNSTSYLYLAKIYNIKEDQKKEEKNLKATLLIEPNNEEAILMSMKIALEKSNYKEVKDLSKTFKQVCKKLCDENKDILETLANIEPKNNES